MNILVCCDSFKDSLSSGKISTLISQNILRKFPKAEIICAQVADGGEGSLDALNSKGNYQEVRLKSLDALLRPIQSKYLISEHKQKAIIELAQTCGLPLLNSEERNCYNTSTFGVGVQIKHALGLGVKSVDILIGGSATNDLGVGMAAALSNKFYKSAELVKNPIGKDLISIDDIEINNEVKSDYHFNVICDVDNVLLGPAGATYTYGPQKGASNYELTELEKGAKNIVKIISEKYNQNHHITPGAGAAGGMGYGAMTFLNAKIVSGADYFINELQLADKINKADLIITGEGKIDEQTKHGKLIYGITNSAKLLGKTVVAVCALSDLDEEEIADLHINQVYSLYDVAPEEISNKETIDRLKIECQKLISDHLVQ